MKSETCSLRGRETLPTKPMRRLDVKQSPPAAVYCLHIWSQRGHLGSSAELGSVHSQVGVVAVG